MSARQVEIRGCLPTAIALVLLGVVLAAVTTAGVALLAVAAGAAIAAATVRGLRRLAGSGDAKTPPARRAADQTLEADWVEPPEGGEDRPPKRLE